MRFPVKAKRLHLRLWKVALFKIQDEGRLGVGNYESPSLHDHIEQEDDSHSTPLWVLHRL